MDEEAPAVNQNLQMDLSVQDESEPEVKTSQPLIKSHSQISKVNSQVSKVAQPAK